MKAFLIGILFFSFIINAFGQQDNSHIISVQILNTDTTIGTSSYKIIERFKSGKVKQIGNYMENCSNTKLCKQGIFIKFNSKGKKINECVYCFDKKICRKFLWLKQGQWGIYGNVNYYFLGFVTKRLVIDPCF